MKQEKDKSSNQDNQTCSKKKLKKMAAPTYSTSTQLVFLLMTAYSTSSLILQTNAQTCKCFEGSLDYSSCKSGQADYRSHDHPDIGLVGSCLPRVPAKYVKPCMHACALVIHASCFIACLTDIDDMILYRILLAL